MEFRYGQDEERYVKKDENWNKFKESMINKGYMTFSRDAVTKHKNINNEVKSPVASYGLIEFVEHENSIYYHVFRKRHTLEFDILAKGDIPKYKLYDILALLSDDEIHRLKTCTIEEIWDDYWVDDSHPEISVKFRNKISEAMSILNNPSDDVKGFIIPRKINQRPFIFPKGRPDKNETGLETAIREAQEETKHFYDICNFETGRLKYNTPLVQYYIGSDGNPYVDYYYIWQSKEIYESKLQYAKHKTPKTEIEMYRHATISHELEYGSWIEIPKFKTTKDFLEWKESINSYAVYAIFNRHFSAIMEIHSTLHPTE